jgi:hypothetical protein
MSMKSSALSLVSAMSIAAISAAYALLSGCNGSRVATDPNGRRYEELSGDVPAQFTDAAKWNSKDICPEGTELSPLMRYKYGPDQKSYGFTYYFGRSCNIVTSREDENASRNLASPSPSLDVSLQPHGPYVWWYENGHRMGAGTFDHGTLASDWSRWEPDGSLAVK